MRPQRVDAEEDGRSHRGMDDAVHHAAGFVDQDNDLPAIDVVADARVEIRQMQNEALGVVIPVTQVRSERGLDVEVLRNP
jgi:hypothetical protein